jgi:hypothetical protein
MPADVFDYLGTEAAQLRLDDNMRASGQTVTATADAIPGATSIPCTALQAPLIAGTVLEWNGGGMPATLEVTLAATAPLGSTSLAVLPLAAQVNAQASAADSGVNLALAQRLVKACYYATDQVGSYLTKYDGGQLARNWSVNRWATALASRWLAKRCLRPCPQSLIDDAEEAIEEMTKVQVGMNQLPNVPMRTSGWPFLSNVTIDVGYDYAKVRVESPLSEGTPTQYGQLVDWNSALWIEL